MDRAEPKKHEVDYERSRITGHWRCKCRDCAFHCTGPRDAVITRAEGHATEWVKVRPVFGVASALADDSDLIMGHV